MAIKNNFLVRPLAQPLWETFGGSCGEISRFLGDILMRAEDGKVPDEAFADECRKVCIQMRSLFVDYGYTRKRQAFFRAIHKSFLEARTFPYSTVFHYLQPGVFDEEQLREELCNLVRHNFLAYNLVTAEYAIQGRSMEIGLAMFVEMRNAVDTAKKTEHSH